MEKIYTCALCGKSYDSVIERAKCEQKCYAKQQEEEKKAAEAKKKEERNARHAKVTKMIDDAYTELNKYVKDYGSYSYDGNSYLPNDDLSLMKFLHNLLF